MLRSGQGQAKGGRFDAGRPDHELGIDNAPVCELDAIGHDGGDPRRSINFHTESGEEFGRGCGDARRQSRQNSTGGFDEVQRNVAIRVDAVEPKGHEVPRGLMQFGGELDSSGAGANDRDLKLTRPQWRVLVLGPQACIDEAAVESRGLLRRFQGDRVLRNAGRAEIIGEAADRQDQRIVGITSGRRHFGAVLFDTGPTSTSRWPRSSPIISPVR